MFMRIRTLRTQNNLTQAELAARAGVDCSTVTKWESEAALPKTRQLPQLARVLNCKIDELFVVPQNGGTSHDCL